MFRGRVISAPEVFRQSSAVDCGRAGPARPSRASRVPLPYCCLLLLSRPPGTWWLQWAVSSTSSLACHRVSSPVPGLSFCRVCLSPTLGVCLSGPLPAIPAQTGRYISVDPFPGEMSVRPLPFPLRRPHLAPWPGTPAPLGREAGRSFPGPAVCPPCSGGTRWRECRAWTPGGGTGLFVSF